MEEWSYRKLCDAYRQEKDTNALGKLASDFDQSLMDLLATLHQKAASSHDSVRELENARRMALELLRLRRHKIILRALMVHEHGDVEGMGVREHALYDSVRNLCAKEDDELAAQVLKPLDKMPSSGAPALVKKVHILKEIPAYRGADAATYGPYAPGQTAELPEGEASWMMKGGMATDAPPTNGGSNGSGVQMTSDGQKVIYVQRAVKIKKMLLDMEVPEYTNPEGASYGPFHKGEVVEVPEDEARFLIRGKLGIETD